MQTIFFFSSMGEMLKKKSHNIKKPLVFSAIFLYIID